MVSLDALFALEDVRVDGALCEEGDAVELCCFFSEDLDEFLADDVTLLLGIRYAGQEIQESVYSIDIDEVCAKLVPEDLAYHFRLAFTEKSVINVNANEIRADSLDKEGCDY